MLVLILAAFTAGLAVGWGMLKKTRVVLDTKAAIRELARLRDAGEIHEETANKIILAARDERDKIRAHERALARRGGV